VHADEPPLAIASRGDVGGAKLAVTGPIEIGCSLRDPPDQGRRVREQSQRHLVPLERARVEGAASIALEPPVLVEDEAERAYQGEALVGNRVEGVGIGVELGLGSRRTTRAVRRGRLSTRRSLLDQLHDPKTRLQRIPHPARRMLIAIHPGLLAASGVRYLKARGRPG
jgi:hypothetical protein